MVSALEINIVINKSEINLLLVRSLRPSIKFGPLINTSKTYQYKKNIKIV